MRLIKPAQLLSPTKRMSFTEQVSVSVQLLVCALLYVGLAKFGMAYMATQPTNITLIWLSVGVAIVMFVRYGFWAAPFVFSASFIANYSGMAQPQQWLGVTHTAVAAVIDMIGPCVIASLINRYLQHGLRYISDLLNLIVRACLLPIVITAVALTANLIVGGYIGLDSFFIYVNKLVLSDMLGAVLVYAIFDAYRNNEITMKTQQVSAALVALSASLLMMVVAKFWLAGVIFLVIPVFIALAFMCVSRYVYIVLTIANAALIIIFSNDFGPFSQPLELQSQVMLQAFIFTLSSLTIGVCVVKAQLTYINDSRHYWRALARYDDLTGLLQRNAFMEILSKRLQTSEFNKVKSCIIIADLDLFKRINDQFGHEAGDAVLAAVADSFRGQLRDHDLAARFGGEEFVLLLSGVGLEQGRRIAERIRLAVSALSFAQYPDLQVTISMGVAVVDYDLNEPFKEAFSQADGLLYEAKREGRNRIVS
ncbi:GGDEF domain-containing protein [Pseudoalteromonas pernae]|uniref:GGDEF domain-containing protein n=1 Tax=Pseudoalteromonas pernae TaxID=3118054 RepID=UPI003242A7E2